jgi:hypothetical protein
VANNREIKSNGTNDSGEEKNNSNALNHNGAGKKQEQLSESSLNHNQASSLNDPPSASSASMASLDVLPPSTTTSQASPSTIPPPANAAQDQPDPLDVSLYSPTSNEPSTTAQKQEQDHAEPAKEAPNQEANAEGGGVNYQALLDNIVRMDTANMSNTTLPAGDNSTVSDTADVPAPSSANLPPQPFAAPVGLPPRPPPQEKPAIHPNYVPGEDIRNYHYPHLHHANAQQSPTSQQGSSFRNGSTYQPAPGTGPGSNGLPPPPLASFQQPARGAEQTERVAPPQQQQHQRQRDAQPKRQNVGGRDDEAPWATEIQKLYDQFLDDEAVYTAEGTWDKFPQGSRLFVGKLDVEGVQVYLQVSTDQLSLLQVISPQR